MSILNTNNLSQRDFLRHTATGLSHIALLQLLNRDGFIRHGTCEEISQNDSNPYAARTPMNAPAAQNVLVIFCSGACSQLETFDYKSELIRRNGQPMPGADGLRTFQGEQGNLTRSPWEFRPRGQSGKMISDLVPHIGKLADELCFIHSLTSKTNTHGPGENFMSTGNILDGFPSMGAWVSWALGTSSQDLPAYVAIPDPRGTPQSSVNNWGSGFLPAAFQGTDFNSSKPLRNLITPKGIPANTDDATRKYLKALNANHLLNFPGDSDLSARLSSYELAARMQLSVPEVTDISSEPASIMKLYGADDTSNPLKAAFARNCILARRLLEKGVRFVQLFNGAYQTGGEGVSNWDGHKFLEQQYSKHGPVMDQPVAALISDLKTRGLLENTVVLWCTEFGRMPTYQKGASGRDHNPDGFTAFLTGAGIKNAYSHGATDDFGYKAIDKVTTVYDLHATILHALGLDHKKLTYYHNGFERRLTDVHGHVIQDILA
ncbi:MAG: DUF1501 domain-containing protein [Verrucomicrobia bacterium]|nr:DUF1501 domain-containing protein [Verrucomicrobiota bacterium]